MWKGGFSLFMRQSEKVLSLTENLRELLSARSSPMTSFVCTQVIGSCIIARGRGRCLCGKRCINSVQAVTMMMMLLSKHACMHVYVPSYSPVNSLPYAPHPPADIKARPNSGGKLMSSRAHLGNHCTCAN